MNENTLEKRNVALLLTEKQYKISVIPAYIYNTDSSSNYISLPDINFSNFININYLIMYLCKES